MIYDMMAENWINGNWSDVVAEIKALPGPIDGFLACEAMRERLNPHSFALLWRRLRMTA